MVKRRRPDEEVPAGTASAAAGKTVVTRPHAREAEADTHAHVRVARRREALPEAEHSSAESEEDDIMEDADDAELDDSDVEELAAAGAIPHTHESAAPRVHVNNTAAMLTMLADMKDENLPWVERLEVVSAEPLTVDPNDDLKLETGFYGQALAAVIAARGELERLGVPHRRPDDYFAAMLKSDEHMQKIKDKLIFEQKKMAAVEARKREKSASLYAKQVAVARTKAKADEKRSTMATLKQWQKHKDDVDGMHDDADAGGPAVAGARRRGKDRKYGFGGKKRDGKENDKSSFMKTGDFSMSRNKSLPPGVRPKFGDGKPKFGGGKPKFGKARNAGGHRPGKAARAARRGGGGGRR